MSGSSTGGGSSLSFAEVTFPTSPGIIVGLGCFTEDDAFGSFETFITAGIKTTDQDGRSRYNQLLSGYVNKIAGLSWQGTYKIEPGEFFYMQIRGNLEFQYTLTDRRYTTDQPKELLSARE